MKPLVTLALIVVALQVRAIRNPSILGSPLGVDAPIAVLNAERAWSEADAFWPLLAQDTHPDVDRGKALETDILRRAALRAIGRAEDPAQVRRLLAEGRSLAMAPVAADAIAQSLYRFDPSREPQLVSDVHRWLSDYMKGVGLSQHERALRIGRVARAASRISYATSDQVSEIEARLVEGVSYSTTGRDLEGMFVAAIQGLEALARVNTKLVQYDERTIDLLADSVKGRSIHGQNETGRLYAFMALVAARALDPDTARVSLSDQGWTVRRAAMAAVAGSGAGLDPDARMASIRAGLDDSNAHVRYEAIRAWGRHAAAAEGCAPLLDALKDSDPHVVIQSFTLLGTLCKDDEDVTNRLQADAATPDGAAWQPRTHAFVALAKRSPERAAVMMPAFTLHTNWWVRMYAAFAAAGAKDLMRLEKLAYDDNDNVREAALNHLQALDPERGGRAVLAALERTDVQLVLTAAKMVKEASPAPSYVAPLMTSLDRLTRTRRITTRDGRMALIDAVERHAKPADHTQLLPWLRDYDPVVAQRAAEAIQRLSGASPKPTPTAAAHIPSQPFGDLRQCVSINMSSGKPIRLRMNPAAAPIAVEHFLKFATLDRYYNGLTIHRVVPNFVIQGGSPGANEYAGSKEYWRDEIAAPNVRGSVGLSIRGRNTGDAQFYVNLVDNPRLDGGYTVFANVFDEDMEVVDRVQEGDVMRSIDAIPCPRPSRR